MYIICMHVCLQCSCKKDVLMYIPLACMYIYTCVHVQCTCTNICVICMYSMSKKTINTCTLNPKPYSTHYNIDVILYMCIYIYRVRITNVCLFNFMFIITLTVSKFISNGVIFSLGKILKNKYIHVHCIYHLQLHVYKSTYAYMYTCI